MISFCSRPFTNFAARLVRIAHADGRWKSGGFPDYAASGRFLPRQQWYPPAKSKLVATDPGFHSRRNRVIPGHTSEDRQISFGREQRFLLSYVFFLTSVPSPLGLCDDKAPPCRSCRTTLNELNPLVKPVARLEEDGGCFGCLFASLGGSADVNQSD